MSQSNNGTNLPGDNSGVVDVNFHEDHVTVVVGHVLSNGVTHRLTELGHGDAVLVLLVRLVEELVEHLQLYDGQLLFQLQWNSSFCLLCTAIAQSRNQKLTSAVQWRHWGRAADRPE